MDFPAEPTVFTELDLGRELVPSAALEPSLRLVFVAAGVHGRVVTDPDDFLIV